MRGAGSSQQTEHPDEDRTFTADEKLAVVLGHLRDEQPFRVTARHHGITDATLRRWRDEMLDGATGALTSPHQPLGDHGLRRQVTDLEQALEESAGDHVDPARDLEHRAV